MISFYELKNNPIFWSNNKRKYHHLPLLHRRKQRRGKFYQENQQKLFNMIEDTIKEELLKNQKNIFKNFVDIKDITIGDKAGF